MVWKDKCRKTTKKALLKIQKCLFHEGGRWDSNPRSSGPQAYADGYSAVSSGLSKYFFAPIFREFEQICRVMPLQKKLSNCRKSVGKILQTITVDTSFFTGCNTGCNQRRKVIPKYTQIGTRLFSDKVLRYRIL